MRMLAPSAEDRLRSPRGSDQILFGYCRAEGGIVADKSRDEFVQAGLENLVDRSILEAGERASGLALCAALPAVGLGDRVEDLHDAGVARMERQRHFEP